MKTIDKMDSLRERIVDLENKRDFELYEIKQHFHTAMADLNPMNLIKNAFTGITTSPTLKSDMLNGAVSIASHFISKSTMLGAFQKPINKILSNVVLKIINKISPKKELS